MWSDSSFLPAPFPFTFVAEGHAGTNEANSTSTPTVADMLAPVVRYERLEDDYAGGDYAFESTDGNLSAPTSASGMSYDYDAQKEGRTIEWSSGDGNGTVLMAVTAEMIGALLGPPRIWEKDRTEELGHDRSKPAQPFFQLS
ncbi:hypothetical protein FOZ62_030622 [Perkinsus olseni]|uniref:Uncharacterized protein n=1 Tax=Perkinsus olseni TaxID=32597 RepID=A0A7J6QZV9_PEROL|nr:hypothetical protein FOZ62_030622 [Perkinsus olseni]